MLVVPLLSHYVERRDIQSKLPLEVDSFKKLAKVVRLVARAKFGGVEPAELDQALLDHGEAFKLAYDDEVKPKFHYARKLTRQLLRDLWLIDCFVLERKHSLLKEAARDTNNTRSFERTVMARTMALQMQELRSAQLTDGFIEGNLCPALAALLGVLEAAVANSISLNGTRIYTGDIIVVDGQPAQVKSCCTANVGGEVELYLLLNYFTFVEQLTVMCGKWKSRAGAQLRVVSPRYVVRLALFWRDLGDGHFVVCV